MKKVNIVSVWTWFSNVLDTQTLTSSEQLIMLHLIKIFNRNFWKPTKVSLSALCRSCSKDSRTAKASLSSLKTKKLVTENGEGELFLGIEETAAEEKAIARGGSTTRKPRGHIVLSETDINAEIERIKRDGHFSGGLRKDWAQLTLKQQRDILKRADPFLKGDPLF